MAELPKWQKKTKNKKIWYEFSFNPKVKIFQGTRYFNPLCELNGEFMDLIQIHSSVIHKARKDIKLVGDGFFTDKKGFNLSIRTADCLPMIFYHPKEEILALLHAGWKGTALLIAKKFLLNMKELYNLEFKDWEVALGPCIDFLNYEVGKRVFEFFDKFNIDGIKKKNDRYFLDLEEANIGIIKKYGIVKIYPFPEKTYTSKLFYSYRKGDTERNITVGVIES
ncbi:polyphenol oxidase family protein [candidate division WOR-3 bacterium]|nr:polyphenol oxidase family protein [candidate division WOR-3 bacterium]